MMNNFEVTVDGIVIKAVATSLHPKCIKAMITEPAELKGFSVSTFLILSTEICEPYIRNGILTLKANIMWKHLSFSHKNF